jgi:hypothetical protein
MKNLARRRVGQHIIEGSLSHTQLVDTGIINNVVDGHLVPKVTGGTESFDVRGGIKYKTHFFTSGGTLTVSGNPRTFAVVSVRGGGGGGAYRWQWGEPGGSGGAGGLGSGLRTLPNGGNSISIGGGGSCSCGPGGTGGTGGTSSALGISSSGGTGGQWSQGPPFGPTGSPGSPSVSGGVTLTISSGTWARVDSGNYIDNSDKGSGYGNGGNGGGWSDGNPSSSPGGSGSAVVRYRWTK